MMRFAFSASFLTRASLSSKPLKSLLTPISRSTISSVMFCLHFQRYEHLVYFRRQPIEIGADVFGYHLTGLVVDGGPLAFRVRANKTRKLAFVKFLLSKTTPMELASVRSFLYFLPSIFPFSHTTPGWWRTWGWRGISPAVRVA